MFEDQKKRNGENPAKHFRSGRFFKLQNYWFFTTREGANMGPFDSLRCAERSVDDYIDFVFQAKPSAMGFFKSTSWQMA